MLKLKSLETRQVSEEIDFNIRTHANPKVVQDHRCLEELCSPGRHATPVADAL